MAVEGHVSFLVVLPFPHMDALAFKEDVPRVQLYRLVAPQPTTVETGEQCPVPEPEPLPCMAVTLGGPKEGLGLPLGQDVAPSFHIGGLVFQVDAQGGGHFVGYLVGLTTFDWTLR